jgi:hypothetical protein
MIYDNPIRRNIFVVKQVFFIQNATYSLSIVRCRLGMLVTHITHQEYIMHRLEFNVAGTVTQQVEWLSEEYSPHDAPLLLEEGTLLTTTWFNGEGAEQPAITDMAGRVVARIHSQQITGEYEDFALSPSPSEA